MNKIAGDIILCICTQIHYHMIYIILCNFEPENQNFEKMKKQPRDFIILHLFAKNLDDIINSSWYMECDRLYPVAPLPSPLPHPLKTQKSKFLKKMKKIAEDIIIHMRTQVQLQRHGVRQTKIFCFWAIFCPFTLLTTPKIKIWKIYS